MNEFDDKVVSFWIVTFDCDTSRTYVYNSLDKMKNAVGSHMLMVLPEGAHPDASEVVAAILDKLDDSILSPIIINDDPLVIRRIDLDRHNPIHKVLSECYDMLGQVQPRTLFDPDNLRQQISVLFS